MRYETDRLILRSWQDSDIKPFAEHVLYRISKQDYYERLQHGR